MGQNDPNDPNAILQQMLGLSRGGGALPGVPGDPISGSNLSLSTLPTDANVYLGTHQEGGGVLAHPRDVADTKTIQQMLADMWAWSPEQWASMGAKMVGAGRLSQGQERDIPQIANQYELILRMSAMMFNQGKEMTPDDILNMMSPGGRFGKPSSYTMTQTITDYTNPDQARAMLVQSLQDKIGRNPTAAEYNAFLG